MRRTRYCNTLQHRLQKTATQTAIQCNTGCQHMATRHCNTLHHCSIDSGQANAVCNTLQHAAVHCSTLQHTAAHCNTLQHTETHSNTQQHTFEQRHGRDSEVVHIHTHSSTLQNTAAHCNTLQHSLEQRDGWCMCRVLVRSVPERDVQLQFILNFDLHAHMEFQMC